MKVPMDERYGGVHAVLATPFGSDGVDANALRRLCRTLVDKGIHSLVSLGNTSEVHQLTRDERQLVLGIVAEECGDSLAVAGVLGGLDEVIAQTSQAAQLGYEAVMVHEPLDPYGDASGLGEWFHALASGAELPIIPYVRAEHWSLEVLGQLITHPKVAAVKWARPVTDSVQEFMRESASQVVWVCGRAEAELPRLIAANVRSFTSGIANFSPEVATHIWSLLQQGDSEELRAAIQAVTPIEELRRIRRGSFNVSTIKYGLSLAGIDAGHVRPPSLELDKDGRAIVDAFLTAGLRKDLAVS